MLRIEIAENRGMSKICYVNQQIALQANSGRCTIVEISQLYIKKAWCKQIKREWKQNIACIETFTYFSEYKSNTKLLTESSVFLF